MTKDEQAEEAFKEVRYRISMIGDRDFFSGDLANAIRELIRAEIRAMLERAGK